MSVARQARGEIEYVDSVYTMSVALSSSPHCMCTCCVVHLVEMAPQLTVLQRTDRHKNREMHGVIRLDGGTYIYDVEHINSVVSMCTNYTERKTE